MWSPPDSLITRHAYLYRQSILLSKKCDQIIEELNYYDDDTTKLFCSIVLEEDEIEDFKAAKIKLSELDSLLKSLCKKKEKLTPPEVCPNSETVRQSAIIIESIKLKMKTIKELIDKLDQTGLLNRVIKEKYFKFLRNKILNL